MRRHAATFPPRRPHGRPAKYRPGIGAGALVATDYTRGTRTALCTDGRALPMKTFPQQYPGPMQGYATVPATSDAKEYLRLLLRHKFGLLVTFLLGLGLAWLYLISTDPVFETGALVEVNPGGNFVDSGQPQQYDFNAPTIKEEASYIKSRRVLAPVVERFDLRTVASPNRVPVLGELVARVPGAAERIAEFEFARPFAWGPVKIEVAELDMPRAWQDRSFTLVSLGGGDWSLHRNDRVLVERASSGETLSIEARGEEPMTISIAELDAPEGVEFTLRQRSLGAAVSSLGGALSTGTSDSKSRIITVKMSGKNPVRIAEITNAVLEEYRSLKLSSANLQTDTELAFYEENLPRVEEELRSAEIALSTFRRQAGDVNTDAQNLARLARIDVLESERLALVVERDTLSERYTNDHPTLRRFNADIDVLDRQIRALTSQLVNTPDVEREISILQNEVDTKLALFTEMDEKLSKLRIAQAGNVGEVQILDDALPPRRPISPNALLAVVGGTLATLFLYLLWLTLRSALSTVIGDQESLERASGLPVFMNIPKSSAQRRIGGGAIADPRRLLPGGGARGAERSVDSNVLALSRPEDYSIENLRGLRSMLEDVMSGARNNVLMFTSPLPSMGKSFVSLNLAVLLAQSGKRILLIDADYQRGQLHRSLGLEVGPGLPEVVRGQSELKDTVRAAAVENLYCIPRGFSGDTGNREMPTDREFGAFMRVVAPRFDIVIIDTPPVLSVSTAAALGKHVGSSILVVKEGEVKEPQLAETLKRLTFSGVRVNGCILNSSAMPTPRHYTYYREQLD